MSENQSVISRVSLGLFISLWLCVISVYLITYSGRIESSDSLRVVDATSSLLHFGDLRRDESLFQQAPRNIDPNSTFPFSIYNQGEQAVVYATAIPASLTLLLPSLGFVHTAWLLNILVLSLSVALFFYLARLLDYDQKTALIGSLLFAFGTIIWAYSKTLFRDPLIVFFLVLSLVFLELWRKDYKRFWWLIFAILAVIGAYYSKNSSLVAIPALIIWMLPKRTLPKPATILLDIVLVVGVIVITLIAFNQPFFDSVLLILQQVVSSDTVAIPSALGNLVFSIDARFAQTAIHSYLFSIGGSIWGTSPILLAGIIGTILLIRQNKRRIVWSSVILISAYAVGHALLLGVHWFGGLSLPPRFMLATIPFAMLLVLPVIDAILKSKQVVFYAFFIFLAVFSIAVQIIFSVSLLDAYVELLPSESNGLVEWLPGLKQIEYLRWILLPQSWGSLGWDVAWSRIDAEAIMLGFLTLGVFAMSAFFLPKYRLALNIALSILLVGFTLFSFQKLYREDALYWGDTPELFEVLAILEQEAEPIEPLFLAGSADVTYERFILNYNQSNTIRPIVLGFAQGERTSPVDTPAVTSDFSSDRLNVTMLRYLDHVASFHDRMWWLAHNSEFLEWSIRPEERYLTENYYLLNEYRTSNHATVRLLEFSTVQAPNNFGFRLPDNSSDFRFGEHITLEGYSLPSGISYQTGDVVPISFYWQTDTILDVDYTVSWFLVHNEQAYPAIQGVDSVPSAGFAPTFLWESNQLVMDNRSIEFPDDAPAGLYEIWVRLYVAESGGALQLPVIGGETYENTTAILPLVIELVHTN